MTNLLWLCVISSGLLNGVHSDPFYKDEQRLKKTILTDYDNSVPPREDKDGNVSVTLGLSLVSVDELDLSKQILYTHVWKNLRWEDSRLKWHPEEYNGLSSISILPTLLWRPDIIPYNFAGSTYAPSTDYNTVVRSTGEVAYIPHVRLATACATDLKAFPFDTQKCTMKFGSWVYDGTVVQLKKGSFDTSIYQTNQIWNLVNATGVLNTLVYECCPEPYMDYTVSLTLRRRAAGLNKIYVAPAICIGLLLPSMFLLPAGSSHKLIVGTCLLVSQFFMLEMLVEVIPINDLTSPVLVLYYLGNIILISVAMVLSSVIINLWERAKRGGTGVPPGVEQVFLGVFGRLLCVRREDYFGEFDGDNATKSEQSVDDHAAMVKEYTHLVAPAEWRQLSVILDRLFCIIFLAAAVSMAIALMTFHSKA